MLEEEGNGFAVVCASGEDISQYVFLDVMLGCVLRSRTCTLRRAIKLVSD